MKGFEGHQQLSMNTSAMELKLNAIKILKTLARNLGSSMQEQVLAIVESCILGALNDPYSIEIRQESTMCLTQLVAACSEQP